MNTEQPRSLARRRALALSALLWTAKHAAACGGASASGTGAASVLLEAEETITDGIEAGDTPDKMKDGWSAQYSKFVATLGNIHVRLATDEREQVRAPEVYVIDLKKVPAAGLPLWSFDGLAPGRWEFFFETPAADSSAMRHDSVTQADYEAMLDHAATYRIEGTLTRPDGRSCPPSALAQPAGRESNGDSAGDPCYAAPEVRFAFDAAAPTLFGPCELDGIPGFSVAADAAQTVAATLHGDHLFFNGFPEGAEGGVERRAQWLADCDLNLDGTVTSDELQTIAPWALAQIDDDVQLGGSPITPLDNMLDYVRAQLMTQGHMNGEGECSYNRLTQHDSQ